MRILIVNTSEQAGGAAVASKRLVMALNNNGEKAKMLVRDKSTDNISIVALPGGLKQRWHFLWERLRIYMALKFNKDHLWEIDIANAGTDITSLKEFKEADVIHLAWINQGMLSLKGIEKIIRSGKPIVWTMHDLWPATALCHYARGCDSFITGCKNCQLLPDGGNEKDLSAKVWNRKKHIYSASNIHFVTCSRWLENQAKQSGLLHNMSVTSIPNAIDTNIFGPQDKAEAKRALGLPTDKNVILFVAQKVTDERKGARYLIEALNKLKEENPEVANDCVVALLGGHAEELAEQIKMEVYPLGYVSGDKNIAKVYNAADIFVLPSMEDNLPNTLMEALACGVPCVGFNVGGIPEMIDNGKNGYVAKAGDTDDLKKGILWILSEADHEALFHGCISKVSHSYSQQSVAMKYVEEYSRVMAQKGYGL